MVENHSVKGTSTLIFTTGMYEPPDRPSAAVSRQSTEISNTALAYSAMIGVEAVLVPDLTRFFATSSSAALKVPPGPGAAQVTGTRVR